MAEQKFDLGDINWPKFSIRSADGTKDRLEFKVWGGRLRVGIVKDGDFKSFFERPLDSKKLALVKMELSKLFKAGPDSKFPLVFSSWDPEAKKASTDWVLVGLKDSKMVYGIEIHTGGNIHKFAMKGPFGVSRGSDIMNDGDKSEIDLQALLDFLSMEGPIAAMFSNKKRDPSSFKQGGNRSYGGGGNSGGGASNAMATDSDDYF